MKKLKTIIWIVLLAFALAGVALAYSGFFTIFISIKQPDNATKENLSVIASPNIQKNNPQTSLSQTTCGSVDFNILKQSQNKFTETEIKDVIKSLSCINQSLISCSPAFLEVKNYGRPGIMVLRIVGKENLDCNISLSNFNTYSPDLRGKNIKCPIDLSYMVDMQKKYVTNNYDSSILDKLIMNIGVQMANGNKNSRCSLE